MSAANGCATEVLLDRRLFAIEEQDGEAAVETVETMMLSDEFVAANVDIILDLFGAFASQGKAS